MDAEEWCPTNLNVYGSQITGNWGSLGAGIQVGRQVNAIITDCDITDNLVFWDGSSGPDYYPCVVGNVYGSLTLERCKVQNNWSDLTYVPTLALKAISPQTAKIIDCDIRSNDNLDGVYLAEYDWPSCDVIIKNTLLAYNRSGILVIGMPESSALITNCTVVANSNQYNSPPAGGIGAGIYVDSIEDSVTIENSIVYGNTDQEEIFSKYGRRVFVNYCNVQGGWSGAGTGNMDVDPLFADSYVNEYQEIVFGEDFHLKSTSGRYDPITKTRVKDTEDSCCIDAGDPSDSSNGEPLGSGGRINMGCYGGTCQASLTNVCSHRLAGDVDGDCMVNVADFAAVAGNWMQSTIVP